MRYVAVHTGSRKISAVRTEFILENRGSRLNSWKARFLKEKFEHSQMAENPVFF